MKAVQQASASVFSEENLPKIGIRPTIDGRLGGVRESLEKQTMGRGNFSILMGGCEVGPG